MMLDSFIAAHRTEIVSRCRAKAATRSHSASIDAGTEHGVPVFLDQLRSALRSGTGANPEIGQSAVQHGHDLLAKGFSVSQVVHDYGDVCQSITELAVETDAPISTADFGTLNRCLDDAIAGAVTQYGRERDQSTLDVAATQGSERLGFFAHELRNLVSTAIASFGVLRTGSVGITGSTGSVLHRTLIGLRSLIDRSLAETRLTEGVQDPEPIVVSTFVEDLRTAGTLEASVAGVRLVVLPGADDVVIKGDRQVLAAVVTSLLQNAFKFTRPDSGVTLRVAASAERVCIEIEDECGGLPGGDGDHLFRPLEQRDADRTGWGLGLAFSRWGVEANHGRIYARNLPDRGCIFTVDLPRYFAADLLIRQPASFEV
jgi:signal transduction histidine kinase